MAVWGSLSNVLIRDPVVGYDQVLQRRSFASWACACGLGCAVNGEGADRLELPEEGRIPFGGVKIGSGSIDSVVV